MTTLLCATRRQTTEQKAAHDQKRESLFFFCLGVFFFCRYINKNRKRVRCAFVICAQFCVLLRSGLGLDESVTMNGPVSQKVQVFCLLRDQGADGLLPSRLS